MKKSFVIFIFISIFCTSSGICQNEAQVKLDNMKYYLSVIKEYAQSMRQYADSTKIIQLLDQMDEVTLALEDEVYKITVPEEQANTVNNESQQSEQKSETEMTEESTKETFPKYEKPQDSGGALSKMLPFKNKFNTSIKFQFGINALIDHNEPRAGILSPEINTGGSWYWDVALVRKARLGGENAKVALNYGLGYLKNTFDIENDLRLVSNNTNKPEFVAVPDAKDHPTMSTGHIYLPLSLTFSLSRKVKIEAGGYFGYRVASSQKIELKSNKEIIHEHRKSSYNFNNWVYGTQFSLDVSGFDLIFRYNASKLFKESSIHDLNTWMVGTSFSLF